MNPAFWRGRSVFLTGHTGFKGGWLALWLSAMGANVHGYALAPSTDPALFDVARVGEAVTSSTIADIRDAAALDAALAASQAEIVMHLAAQPLVLESYREPIETFDVNVMGTLRVLDACRRAPHVKAVIVVTSDKCYENRETIWAYRETDAMGGHDPYSGSKGACEVAVASFARSFFHADDAPAIASARAGNVIGGGDWSRDRLVVDLLEGLSAGRPAVIRRPASVRPWQHVLEPIGGYLHLAEHLLAGPDKPAFEGWNFGPRPESERTVRDLAERLTSLWGRPDLLTFDPPPEALHEATLLKLDVTKAAVRLDWRPRLDFETTLRWTIDWRRAFDAGEDMQAFTQAQIDAYTRLTP